MQIVEFYNGERGNNEGFMLDTIMTWSDGALEVDHDWIQWVFGSNEPSGLNGDAPTMTREESEAFSASLELREKVKASFLRFLKFLGMKLDETESGMVVVSADGGKPKWLRGFNHNMLRATRVLKCMRLTGLTEYAVAFYDGLRAYQKDVSPNTWGHWTRAAFDPLW